MAKLPNTVLRVAARSLAIAAAVLGLAAGAQAQTIAAWSANGTNAPSYVDPNFTATNLSGNVPFGSQTIGYIPEGDAWSVAFGSFGTNPLPSFSTSVTAGITTMVGNFKFTLFNNDCETNGNPFSNCTGVKWDIKEDINGGGFTTLLIADSGAAYAAPTFSIPLGQTWNPGDVITFTATAKSGPVVSTGQYIFSNIEIDATSIPEPASLTLLGLSLAGLAAARRKRA